MKRTSADLDQLAEGVFKGISPIDEPWHGSAPEFRVSFAGVKTSAPLVRSVGDRAEVSALLESGEDGAHAESYLFWKFLKAFPSGAPALLKAFIKSFKAESPRFKKDIFQHYSDPRFASHLLRDVFGWHESDDWEDPKGVSIKNVRFGKPMLRVPDTTIRVPWSVEVSFTAKKKSAAAAVFSGMSDRELDRWIGEWENQAPENFWMDGELQASRPQAYKMYRDRWRKMSPRDQERMYMSLSHPGRFASKRAAVERDKKLSKILGTLFGELKRDKKIQQVLMGFASQIAEEMDCDDLYRGNEDGMRNNNPDILTEWIYERNRNEKWVDLFAKESPKIKGLIQQYTDQYVAGVETWAAAEGESFNIKDAQEDAKRILEEEIQDVFFQEVLPDKIDGDEFRDEYSNVRSDCDDQASYRRDPYAYYGVSRRDFLSASPNARRVAARFMRAFRG